MRGLADVAPGPWRATADGVIRDATGKRVAQVAHDNRPQEETARVALALESWPELVDVAQAALAWEAAEMDASVPLPVRLTASGLFWEAVRALRERERGRP